MFRGAWGETQDAIRRNSDATGRSMRRWCWNIPEGLFSTREAN